MHKPTTFQMMAFAVLDGRELTVISHMNLKAGQVTVSDFKTELEEPARRFAQERQASLLDIAKAERQPLTRIRVRFEVRHGERAPAGFLSWKQSNFFDFDVVEAVPA